MGQMCQGQVGIHVDKGGVAGYVRVFPPWWQEHLPTVLENQPRARVAEMEDILDQSKVKLFETGQPVKYMLPVLPANGLLEEESCHLIQ